MRVMKTDRILARGVHCLVLTNSLSHLALQHWDNCYFGVLFGNLGIIWGILSAVVVDNGFINTSGIW